jgi:Na+-transporting NADH:ubiquinone oxidoreductase subunit B
MSASPAKKQALVKWYAPHRQVLWALLPVTAAAVYFFGWRSLVILALVNLFGFLTEYLFLRAYKEPVSSAVFVTSFLFTLCLPPTIPYWMAAVGIVFGVLFGKMVFGGFGRNVFNPAMVGRGFLYVSFGVQMTSGWLEPLRGFPAGLARFSADAVTRATPLVSLADGGSVSWQSLLLGNVAGSLGETSALLLLIGGLYILVKKAANYRIVISAFLSFLVMQTVLWLAGVPRAVDPWHALLAGSFMMGAFFIITDPISASQTNPGRWIFGAFFGFLVVIIRLFSVWPAAVMFATLLANMFAPILDVAVRQIMSRRARRKEAADA